MDRILVWFRRDLRDQDHAALAQALRRAREVYCVFLFDRAILDALPSRRDRRVVAIHQALCELDAALRRRGGALYVCHGMADEDIPRLAGALRVAAVFVNRDYEPAALARDGRVAIRLAAQGIAFEAFKDQVIFDGVEVLTQAGRPYTVFTPYRRAWLARLTEEDLAPHDTAGGRGRLCVVAENLSEPVTLGVPTLSALGFEAMPPSEVPEHGAGMSGAAVRRQHFLGRLTQYAVQRDFPAHAGTSRLSPHLRFGTISVRQLVADAVAAGALRARSTAETPSGAAAWLSELVWREFYFMIIAAFPHVATRAFKPEYDAITWADGEQADADFAAWCAGKTGYPLVDAGMRQLARTGELHNRLRMIVASFLCKDLGIDWRRGEAWFAAQLNDFDLAANNGGWQWSASTGCDAQPYFRIFNPVTQSERFDPEGTFIRRFIPELAEVPTRWIHAPWLASTPPTAYPAPRVNHASARAATLARYGLVKASTKPSGR
ncbi:MAG: deoxyribodipyrimidine photo-lyase [Candidatus Accumulibacter sp.]|nr:deoxyribodipyrimidine photo-lyase [Accumulibacter sp.]